jgi:hypothetical protein
MIMSPVPVLVGLTHPEHLDSTVESARLYVNCDVKLVIDTPVFEADSPLRFKVLEKQLVFQSTVSSFMQNWRQCRGFPHSVAMQHVQRFISEFLQVYTGPVPSSKDLFENLHLLPEYMKDSQVASQLIAFKDLTPDREAEFRRWFAAVFPVDTANEMKRVGTTVEISRAEEEPRSRTLSTLDDQRRKAMAVPGQPSQGPHKPPPASIGGSWGAQGSGEVRRFQTVAGDSARPSGRPNFPAFSDPSTPSDNDGRAMFGVGLRPTAPIEPAKPAVEAPKSMFGVGLRPTPPIEPAKPAVEAPKSMFGVSLRPTTAIEPGRSALEPPKSMIGLPPKPVESSKSSPAISKTDAPVGRANAMDPGRSAVDSRAKSLYQPAAASESFQAKMAAFSGGAIPQPPAAAAPPATAPQKLAIPPAFAGAQTPPEPGRFSNPGAPAGAQKPPEPGRFSNPGAFAGVKGAAGKK